jgi:hypothetical protein
MRWLLLLHPPVGCYELPPYIRRGELEHDELGHAAKLQDG